MGIGRPESVLAQGWRRARATDNRPLNFGAPPKSRRQKAVRTRLAAARGNGALRRQIRCFPALLTRHLDAQVDFSRDGNWAAYVKYNDGTLWRSKPDGSEKLQLTYSPLQVTVPYWSPDGTRIAFSGAKPGEPYRIYVIPADGGNPEQISSGQSEMDPTWSKDGNALMFGVVAAPGNIQPKIMLLDLKTHALTQVAGSDGICCPRWSPDGHYVIGLSADNQKLLLLDLSTQKWRQLADKIGTFGYMTWSWDRKYIFFDTSSTLDPAFFRRVRRRTN